MPDALPDPASLFRLDDPAAWDAVQDAEAVSALMRRLFGPWRAAMDAASIEPEFAVRITPAYPMLMLVRVLVGDAPPVFAVLGPDFLRYLEGTLADFTDVNLRQPPELDDEADAIVYLRAFLEIARGDEGWRLVERAADLDQAADLVGAGQEAAQAVLHPIRLAPQDEQGRWHARAIVQHQNHLVSRHLLLWPDGLVQTKAQENVFYDFKLARPAPFPTFHALRNGPLAGLTPEDGPEPARLLQGTLDETGMMEPAAAFPPPQHPVATQPKQIADVFRMLAGQLLDATIEKSFRPPGRSADPVSAFAEYLRTFRPTIAIETPYRELREEFARVVAEACGLPLDLDWQGGPSEAPGGRMRCGTSPSVVLLTEATFGTQADGTEREAGLVLAPIVHGPHIGLFIVERIGALQQNARDMIDLRFTVPRLDEMQFWAATRALFGPAVRRRPGARDWVGYVLPRDLARAAAAAQELGAFLRELEQTIRRRLAQYTDPTGPALADLHGMGEARYRMEELSADIAAAQRGDIPWDQVDRGYLLVGPPGTGKTTLVRALARQCGVRFVLASAGAWQEGGSLGPHVQNIRRTFREARFYAPAILFIDEIDGIGSRGKTEAHNSQYQTVVINTVLEELQGFEGREGVIVIGATNNPDDVDPALRRPGRLDRIIEVAYPNVAALAQIYDYYLARAARDGFAAPDVDAAQLARMTFGRTGSHVELYVRGAVRRARRAGRKELTAEDLLAEITDRPPAGLELQLSDGAMRRVAVHEAGHALLTLTAPLGAAGLSWASITPRANGSLGFVARGPDEQLFSTHAEMEENTRMILAGRAAEEVVFGRASISTGAGGPGNSDLAAASRTVMRMLTQFGFSEASGLLWVDWRADGEPMAVTAEAIRNLPLGNEILHEARSTLERLYGETIERITTHRAALDRIVALLIARQDVSPEELAAAMQDTATNAD
jgi:ATP-dependent Zn protease